MERERVMDKNMDKKKLKAPSVCFDLPDSYEELCRVDLQKDGSLAVLVNILALVIFLAGGVIGHQFVPIHTFYSMSDGMLLYFVRLATACAGVVLYVFLHESVHGIFIKHYSGRKAQYGFTGLYAYAGSEAYFNKRQYLVIALAPIVIWGIVLTVFLIFVPESWFWAVYFIQLINLSGAAGDLYVVWKFSGMRRDILIRDSGTDMTVYAPVQEADIGQGSR